MATENKQVSTWLPPNVAEAIATLAARDRRTVSMWIRLVLEERVAQEEATA